MTLKVEIKIDKRVIDDKIAGKRKKAYDGLFKGVQFARGEMLLRTERGQGVDGQRFPAYSKAYAEVRRKYGATTSVVTHFFGVRIPGAKYPTGMLRSISERIIRMTKSSVEIHVFPSPAQAPKVRYTNTIRRWFGFGAKERAMISKEVKKAIGDKSQ
jgi:hypothetical protein